VAEVEDAFGRIYIPMSNASMIGKIQEILENQEEEDCESCLLLATIAIYDSMKVSNFVVFSCWRSATFEERLA